MVHDVCSSDIYVQYDIVVLMVKTQGNLMLGLNSSQQESQQKGLRISRSKTKVIDYDYEVSDQEINRIRHLMKISDDIVCETDRFKYL